MKCKLYLPILVLLLLQVSCNDRLLTQYEVQKTFTQTAIKPIDVLLVVDNSLSMKEENPQVQAGASQLVNALVNSNANLHLGVITMNIEKQLTSGVLDQAGLLQAPSGVPSYQETDSMDGATIISNFQQVLDYVQFNQNVGTDETATPNSNVNGKGCEAGLEAARLATQPGRNPGFLREGSHLAIIFMTDEDEASINPQPDDDCPAVNSSERVFAQPFSTVSQYLNYFDELTIGNYSMHGILTLPNGANPCTSPQEVSNTFVEAIEPTHGFTASICTADFTDFLDDLGLSIAALANKFIVRIPIDATTLHVFQNGVEVSSSTFTIIDDGRAILFNDTPPEGTRIEIRFFSDTNSLVLVN